VAASGTRIIRDLEYTTGGGKARSLDLYLPAPTLVPLPLVVWIHGGSWRGGDKAKNKSAFLSAHGFATASLNYRLLQEAPFPAQIQDCKAAIRFLRAHAAEFNLDPTRIGVWGESAGGNLAALLGTTDRVAELEGTGHGGQSRIQAVCDWFGPTDMPTLLAHAKTVPPTSPLAKETKTILDLLGETPSAEVQRQASPLAFVSRDDAPFFILHGDQDPLVPLGQSEALCAALRAAGVEASLLVLPGAGHGGAAFETPAVQARIHEFFATHLSVQ
jgi:acetyl esterase/lipase